MQKKKWPKGRPTDLRSPFRDGNEKAEKYDGFKNTIAVTANSNYQPGVVNEKMEDITTQEEFYAGCYARATLNAYAYEKMGNRGISFSLQNLQKLGDGEYLSGKNDPKDDFGPVVEDGSVSAELFEK